MEPGSQAISAWGQVHKLAYAWEWDHVELYAYVVVLQVVNSNVITITLKQEMASENKDIEFIRCSDAKVTL